MAECEKAAGPYGPTVRLGTAHWCVPVFCWRTDLKRTSVSFRMFLSSMGESIKGTYWLPKVVEVSVNLFCVKGRWGSWRQARTGHEGEWGNTQGGWSYSTLPGSKVYDGYKAAEPAEKTMSSEKNMVYFCLFLKYLSNWTYRYKHLRTILK